MLQKVFGGFWLFYLFTLPLYAQLLTIENPSQSRDRWVDSVFQTLSLEQKIGQLMMVAAYSNGSETDHQKTEKLIKEYGIGGLIFMQGGPMRQAQLTNRFQSQAKVPLMIGMDLEWGLAMRLDSTISFPRQMTLGAVRDDQLVYQLGAEIARQMKILGVHVNFAPVIDINSNPDNPVIGFRSFGESRDNVTRKGLAYMKGLQDNGIIACAKHFPGHGDTHTDSHLELPIISSSIEDLNQLELYPFRTLIENQIQGIMVAHLNVPALQNGQNRPASISEDVIQGYLRRELDFNGLVFSDALNMRGVNKGKAPGEVVELALSAGNDVLVFAEDVPNAIKRIKKLLRKNKEKKAQLDQSVRKVLTAKYQAGLSSYQKLNLDNLMLRLNTAEAHQLKNNLYEQSITVVNDQQDRLPLKVLDTLTFASLTLGEDHPTFQEYLSKYTLFSHYNFEKQMDKHLVDKLASYDIVVVGLFDLNGRGSSNYGIKTEQLSLLKKLNEKTTVILSVFGSPYALKPFEAFDHIISVYEENELLERSVPQVIFGALPATGKLPVTASEKYFEGIGYSKERIGRLGYGLPEAVGLDSKTLKRIDEIAEEAISDQATPGCQVLVAKGGRIILEKSYGYYTYDQADPVTSETVYDVASITKVMATLQTVMFLEERGVIDLEKKASYYLPELVGTNKENMILIDILTHQAGLWPFQPFWLKTMESSQHSTDYYSYHPSDNFPYHVGPGLFTANTIEDSVWHWVIESKVRKKRPRQPYDYKYSDMGYYIFQRLVEKVLNQPMEDFLVQNFYDPMGLTTTCYLPLCNYPVDRIAPTEKDNYFRFNLVEGMVHDQGAALLGGIAGHAGLFSNALDLAKMMQMLLQEGQYGGSAYFEKNTIEKFTTPPYASNRRGIGWDKPLLGEWYGPTSESASPKTFGHTGFTGTAVWADPEFDLIYVFLSNRIYPDATNTKLLKNNIRTRIQDVIYQAMWNYKKSHF
ncbi:MAG: glycoside hydrolase family 3 N-terminal domain-containing protein [Bacteroidota bacterium]